MVLCLLLSIANESSVANSELREFEKNFSGLRIGLRWIIFRLRILNEDSGVKKARRPSAYASNAVGTMPIASSPNESITMRDAVFGREASLFDT